MHRPRRSIAISTAVSAALHAVPLLAIGWTARLRWPAPPIPVEVRTPPPRPRTPPPEPRREPPPPPKVARAPSGKGPRPKNAGPAKPAPPPLPPPPATADLRPLAPADARVVILLRTDRLRKSPHKTSVEALLEALPDYRTLLDGTGLTPLDDFEALLIATANPRDVTATFLAARHADDNRLRAALARRTMPEWDPRVFRYLSPRLSVLTRPDGAERIDGASVPDAGADDPRKKWLDDLARFERLAEEPGAPSLLVTVSDLGALVAFGGGLPTPASVALAATSDPAPAVRLTIAFADATEAARFEAEWPAIVGRWRSSTLLLGLSSMLDGLAVKRDPAAPAILDLSGRIPEGQITLALSWAKALIPRPPPEAASPDGGAVVDGGGVDAAAADAR